MRVWPPGAPRIEVLVGVWRQVQRGPRAASCELRVRCGGRAKLEKQPHRTPSLLGRRTAAGGSKGTPCTQNQNTRWRSSLSPSVRPHIPQLLTTLVRKPSPRPARGSSLTSTPTFIHGSIAPLPIDLPTRLHRALRLSTSAAVL
jgi:hypothetical protein